MRQVKKIFPAHSSSSEDNRKECSLDQPPWDPQGGPKVPLRPYAEKDFVFESGVQTTRKKHFFVGRGGMMDGVD